MLGRLVCEFYVIFVEVFVEANTHQVKIKNSWELLGNVKQLSRSFYLCKPEIESCRQLDGDMHHRYNYTGAGDGYWKVDNNRKPRNITYLQRDFSQAIVTKCRPSI